MHAHKLPGRKCEHANEFYLEEYRSLRTEIQWLLKDYRLLERNVVVAVAITWAWLFEKRNSLPKWTWLLPVAFSALGAARATGIMRAFGKYGEYMKNVEDYFSSEGDPGGWDHHRPQKIGTAVAAGVFWLLLIVVTLVVACIQFHNVQATSYSHPWF